MLVWVICYDFTDESLLGCRSMCKCLHLCLSELMYIEVYWTTILMESGLNYYKLSLLWTDLNELN